MKTLLALMLLALAGCVTTEDFALTNARRLCRNAESWGDHTADCVQGVYEAGVNAVPEPQPAAAPTQARSVTCHSSRDFPGAPMLSGVTTTCE